MPKKRLSQNPKKQHTKSFAVSPTPFSEPELVGFHLGERRLPKAAWGWLWRDLGYKPRILGKSTVLLQRLARGKIAGGEKGTKTLRIWVRNRFGIGSESVRNRNRFGIGSEFRFGIGSESVRNRFGRPRRTESELKRN